jgi:hypothetical protein
VQLFLQQREPPWLVFVPISGQYMLLKQALRGESIPLDTLLASYVTPLAIACIALFGVARLLSRESILTGK